MTYKITVITPVYNAEATLPRAFESVRAQTIGFENIEYILADDASTDGSRALIEGWEALYPNVRGIYLKQNSGTAGAPRNAALELASAPYVMFLDNDDCFFSNACLALYNAAQGSGADIVSGDAAEREESGRADVPEQEQYLLKYKGKGEGIYDFSSFDTELTWVFCFNFWTKIYRREIIEKYKIRFSEGLMWEDLVFLFLYLSVCRNGEIIREDVVDYLVRESSLSHVHGMFFYTTIPQSMALTIKRAREIGSEERCAELMDLVQVLEYYVNTLLNAEELDDGQLHEVLESWREVLAYAHNKGFHLHSSYAKIIARDCALLDSQTLLFDFIALRELYFQRKRELDGIFSSKTWKAARVMQNALGALKGVKR